MPRRLLLLLAAAAGWAEGQKRGGVPAPPPPPPPPPRCAGQWWRRVTDGLLLREAEGSRCPRAGGGSLWADVEVPTDDPYAQPRALTVELERGEERLFVKEDDSTIAKRFAEAGRRCSSRGASPEPKAEVDCASHGPNADHRAASEESGQRFCAHPEAKETRAFFCRYPPRFYGHQGICRNYAQFCPFQELEMETDARRVETAVVNVDAALYQALETCGALKEEVWIFKVFVHWCPHCQQLMPRLYKLALVLQQHGVRRVRFGAVNCATEHEFCAAQKWPGHPLLVARYLGPDRAVHDAIEHWVDAVKDAQLRTMLPRYACPGEYPLLKVLLEQLPEKFAPRRAWGPLFEEEGEGGSSGACPNVTAMHPVLPGNVDEAVGNGWSDAEVNFTRPQHWADTLLMVRQTLQEWIAPLGDDGNVEAFSYGQVRATEAWVGLLSRNLPPAFGLREAFAELRRALRGRLRAAQTMGGAGGLCAEEWKDLTAPVLKEIAAVGQQNFSVPSACASETCRMWSLLHTLAAEGYRRLPGGAAATAGEPLAAGPAELLASVRGFIAEYFKCLYCRRHFLEQFDRGSYGLRLAQRDAGEAVLWFWRLHNAVSVRVTAEHGCHDADRRWPPLSVCSKCWDVGGSGDWEVLSEALALQQSRPQGGGAAPRALRALESHAQPNEPEVLHFLLRAFSDWPAEGQG